MKPARFFAYTAAVIVIAAGAIWYIVDNYYEQQVAAGEQCAHQIVMYKNPCCECCIKWAQHMKQAGFAVTEQPTPSLQAVKADHNVPYNLGSCHTALVDGYVVEGHVPVKEVERLLEERPAAVGIAVPGMPIGSPGMEQGSRTESYDVVLFDDQGNRENYASY